MLFLVKTDKESFEGVLDTCHNKLSERKMDPAEKNRYKYKNFEVLTEALKQTFHGCLHGTIICI